MQNEEIKFEIKSMKNLTGDNKKIGLKEKNDEKIYFRTMMK